MMTRQAIFPTGYKTSRYLVDPSPALICFRVAVNMHPTPDILPH